MTPNLGHFNPVFSSTPMLMKIRMNLELVMSLIVTLPYVTNFEIKKTDITYEHVSFYMVQILLLSTE